MRRRSTSRRRTSTRSSSRRSRRTTRTSTSGWPPATSLWYQDKGFGDHVRRRSGRRSYSLPTADKTLHRGRVLGQPGDRDLVRPVLEQRRAFARGAVVGTFDGRHVDVQGGRVPGRLPEPVPPGRGDRPEGREPPDRGINGFSRRFTEGPGAGIGHIYESKDGGLTWTDISGNFPDIPVNDVVSLQSGGLLVGDRPRRSLSRPGVSHVAAARQPAAGHGRDGPDARPRRQRLRGDARSRHLAHHRRRPLGPRDITLGERAASGRPARRFAVDISGVVCDDRHALAGRCRESAEQGGRR